MSRRRSACVDRATWTGGEVEGMVQHLGVWGGKIIRVRGGQTLGYGKIAKERVDDVGK